MMKRCGDPSYAGPTPIDGGEALQISARF